MAAACAEDGLHTGLEFVQQIQRNERLRGAGKAAAMDADTAAAVQQMLGSGDS